MYLFKCKCFFYFTGNADPVFYFCFDSLNNVQLMEGAVTTDFNGLVDGKVNISQLFLLYQLCELLMVSLNPPSSYSQCLDPLTSRDSGPFPPISLEFVYGSRLL